MTSAIAAKLGRVLAKIRRVPKNGKNNFHKYDYATESDLTDFVRPLLAEEGLTILPSVDEYTRTGDKKDGFKVTVKMSFTIISDDGGSLGPFSWYGDADDKNDKALYKAITGGVKYFLFKLFLVSTGDDPENDAAEYRKGSDKPQPKKQDGAQYIREQVKEYYDAYFALLGQKNHVVNAMKKVTGKDRSADYTTDDLDRLDADLRERQDAKGGTE